MVRASQYIGPLALLAGSVVVEASATSKHRRATASYPELGYTKCIAGWAQAIPGDRSNTFKCSNTDLYHFLSHEELGDDTGLGSSSWGWTSEDGREFVAIGQNKGTAFVEIGSDGKLTYLGRLPASGSPSEWREIRVYKSYAIIGSEGANSGVQIFDLEKLLDIDPASPVVFDAQDDLTSHFDSLLPLGRSHNIVVNEELDYAATVGALPRSDANCYGGLNFFDLEDPENPVSLGCASGDGYVQDAQCLVYRGPDSRYDGRDICYGYNEDTITIYDVTDKANVTNIISRTTYDGASYTHQGQVLDVNNQEFLVSGDELDEVFATGRAAAGYPVTYIWDIRDLENPVLTGSYTSKVRGVDHNQYVVDGLIYQSNYGSGLRVLDASSIPTDPTGAGVCEAAFFDVYPEDDFNRGGGDLGFTGTWSSYAYFESGFIFINTIERGAFVVKLTSKTCPSAPVCNADNCLRSFRASHIPGRLDASREFCEPFLADKVVALSALPTYAISDCKGDAIARASSACACLPTATATATATATPGP